MWNSSSMLTKINHSPLRRHVLSTQHCHNSYIFRSAERTVRNSITICRVPWAAQAYITRSVWQAFEHRNSSLTRGNFAPLLSPASPRIVNFSSFFCTRLARCDHEDVFIPPGLSTTIALTKRSPQLANYLLWFCGHPKVQCCHEWELPSWRVVSLT